MSSLRPDTPETCALLEQFRQGDSQVLEELLQRSRLGLRAFIEARFDKRLYSRLDPSDIVQETQLEVARRIDDYLERQPMPFHLWLRKTAYERMLDAGKHHRKRQRRSVDREVALPTSSSVLLALPLFRKKSSPTQRLQAQELAEQVALAVQQLSGVDQEILLMRHGEEMPFAEIACVLGIASATARKRFGRALLRLQTLLTEQGLLE